jgi:hypothetical protein
MAPRSWIIVGWVFAAAAAGLAIAAIVQALDAVSSAYDQRLVTNGLAAVAWQAAVAEFVRGIICAVFAEWHSSAVWPAFSGQLTGAPWRRSRGSPVLR